MNVTKYESNDSIIIFTSIFILIGFAIFIIAYCIKSPFNDTIWIRSHDVSSDGKLKIKLKGAKIVRCSGVKELKEFPLWEDIEEIYCSDLNIKNFPLWKNIKKVHCHKCYNIEEFPLWENIEEISCLYMDIKNFPLWTGIKKVYCSNCFKLENFPLWEKIEIICCVNVNIISLPLWTNIKEVCCFNCKLLESISLWTTIQKLDCRNCKNLKEIPNFPGNVEILHDENMFKLARKIYVHELCVVCLTNVPNVIFSSCGHKVCCTDCSIAVSKNDRRCPVCRKFFSVENLY